MKLVVGLGNPESKYVGTRHNVGFDIIEDLIKEYDVVNMKEKFKSLYQIVNVNGEKIIFQKPLTYMNLSGDAIVQICNFYKIKSEDVLVIYDDMDIEIGSLKIRDKGSSAGHNGIKSIISNLGEKFLRLKIGISKSKNDKISFVLGPFSSEEKEKLQISLKKVPEIVSDFSKGFDANVLMNKYNGK